MRDGALPAIALCLMLGMMLAYASRGAWLTATLTVALVALGGAAIVLPLEWRAYVVVACWASALLFALPIYAARPVPAGAAIAAGIMGGLATGALAGETGRPDLLAVALPCVLIRLPAVWLVRQRRAIVLKVLTSWIVAVAILSSGLTLAAGVDAGSDHLD